MTKVTQIVQVPATEGRRDASRNARRRRCGPRAAHRAHADRWFPLQELHRRLDEGQAPTGRPHIESPTALQGRDRDEHDRRAAEGRAEPAVAPSGPPAPRGIVRAGDGLRDGDPQRRGRQRLRNAPNIGGACEGAKRLDQAPSPQREKTPLPGGLLVSGIRLLGVAQRAVQRDLAHRRQGEDGELVVLRGSAC